MEQPVIGLVQLLPGQEVVPIGHDPVQHVLAVGLCIEDYTGILLQVILHLSIGLHHMLRVVGVPRHRRQTDGDVQGLRRLCPPDRHLALLRMAVFGMSPHGQLGLVSEID